MTKWDSTALQTKSYMIQELSKTVREGGYGDFLARCCRGLKLVVMMFITGPKS